MALAAAHRHRYSGKTSISDDVGVSTGDAAGAQLDDLHSSAADSEVAVGPMSAVLLCSSRLVVQMGEAPRTPTEPV
jgi:hypothetical protein